MTNTDSFQLDGVFSVPAFSGTGPGFDYLLLELESIWTRMEESFNASDLHKLRMRCVALNQQFSKWQDSLPSDFNPTRVGRVPKNPHGLEIRVGYWPGALDTYFDLYVAGVWNIFRTARLLLVALIIQLSDALSDHDYGVAHIHTANRMVADMIASIPYHLADNLHDFLDRLATREDLTIPGRSLGGLLLMHPLYIASRMWFLPDDVREYMRTCLTWIGSYMGLGQAALFAKVRLIRLPYLDSMASIRLTYVNHQTPDMSIDYLASGCMVIWSGFLG